MAAGKAPKKGDKKNAKRLFSESDLISSIKSEAHKSKIRRGSIDLDPDADLDDVVLAVKTIRRVKKQIKARARAKGGKFEGSKKVVTETTARNKACGDVRMAIQQAVAIEASMGHLPDACKFNVDATSMIAAPDGTGVTQYRIVSEAEANEFEEKELKNVFASINYQESMGIILKWMQLQNRTRPGSRVAINQHQDFAPSFESAHPAAEY